MDISLSLSVSLSLSNFFSTQVSSIASMHTIFPVTSHLPFSQPNQRRIFVTARQRSLIDKEDDPNIYTTLILIPCTNKSACLRVNNKEKTKLFALQFKMTHNFRWFFFLKQNKFRKNDLEIHWKCNNHE